MLCQLPKNHKNKKNKKSDVLGLTFFCFSLKWIRGQQKGPSNQKVMNIEYNIETDDKPIVLTLEGGAMFEIWMSAILHLECDYMEGQRQTYMDEGCDPSVDVDWNKSDFSIEKMDAFLISETKGKVVICEGADENAVNKTGLLTWQMQDGKNQTVKDLLLEELEQLFDSDRENYDHLLTTAIEEDASAREEVYTSEF